MTEPKEKRPEVYVVESPNTRQISVKLIAQALVVSCAFLTIVGLRVAGLISVWALGGIIVGGVLASEVGAAALHLGPVQAPRPGEVLMWAAHPHPMAQALRMAVEAGCVALVGYLICNWAAVSLPLGLQVPVLIVVGAFGVFFALGLAFARVRTDTLTGLQRMDPGAPILTIAFNFVWLCSLFSALAFTLSRHDLLVFDSHHHHLEFDTFMRFYIWHFMDAIPVLNANETLHWNLPLGYDHAAEGALVLSFKLAVIIPLLAATKWWWRSAAGEPAIDAPT